MPLFWLNQNDCIEDTAKQLKVELANPIANNQRETEGDAFEDVSTDKDNMTKGAVEAEDPQDEEGSQA